MLGGVSHQWPEAEALTNNGLKIIKYNKGNRKSPSVTRLEGGHNLWN